MLLRRFSYVPKHPHLKIFTLQGSTKEFSPSPLQGHLYRLSLLSDGPSWNFNAACQNMASILNDPKKGKQKDFFTKTWGDGFAENLEIPRSPLLPEIKESYFVPYLQTIVKRSNPSLKRQSSSPTPEASQQFPNVHSPKSKGIVCFVLFFSQFVFEYIQ